jgi:hypothetical protein
MALLCHTESDIMSSVMDSSAMLVTVKKHEVLKKTLDLVHTGFPSARY